jgi:hypothetical protein
MTKPTKEASKIVPHFQTLSGRKFATRRAVTFALGPGAATSGHESWFGLREMVRQWLPAPLPFEPSVPSCRRLRQRLRSDAARSTI